jgi:hypothetical protein
LAIAETSSAAQAVQANKNGRFIHWFLIDYANSANREASLMRVCKPVARGAVILSIRRDTAFDSIPLAAFCQFI